MYFRKDIREGHHNPIYKALAFQAGQFYAVYHLPLRTRVRHASKYVTAKRAHRIYLAFSCSSFVLFCGLLCFILQQGAAFSEPDVTQIRHVERTGEHLQLRKLTSESLKVKRVQS